MGIFSFFKRGNKSSSTDNGVLGPTFLDNLTRQIQNPQDLKNHEWRRQLVSKTGQTKFKIYFYGNYHTKYPNLIVRTEFAPAVVFAVDELTGEKILFFDGCKHGYNALFCDVYTKEQIENRTAENIYKDEQGNDTFEIILSTFNGFNFEEEFGEAINDEGYIELIDGSKIEFDKAKRNGFDTIQVSVVNNKGKIIEIISEELA